ncbi:PIN domain-containing protein (plasmid) [Streptomyces sp. NBC_01724]|uniref:PIN-like domain-containing protein n=1 Tax=Streptomyces sp. NBC_01724 TaxID=2975922 RepID=UPI002E3816C1|nr:PIN domain-containing protein [Streptomyces sp. NBC_01724]
MKNTFSEYYSPSDAKYSQFLEGGIIALDANVLLAPYKVDGDARRQIFDILTQLKDRLWVPYQAGYEFFKNRPAVMAGEEKVYQSLETPLITARRKVEEHLKSISGHPVITPLDTKDILNGIDQLISKVHTLQKGRDSRLEDSLRNDPILKEWEDLLESRTGERPSPESHNEMIEAVIKRYTEGIPPGLQDEDKPDNSHGDGMLWLQLLNKARVAKSPTLLITDDVKDDWYRRHGGKTIGPRIELVREMQDSAGVAYYQQPLSLFVQRAGAFLHKPVSEKTVRQVVGISASVLSGSAFERSVHSELLTQFPAPDITQYLQEFSPVDLAVRVGSVVVGLVITLDSTFARRNTTQLLTQAINGRKFDAILLVTPKPLNARDRDILMDLAEGSTKPLDAVTWHPTRSNSVHLTKAVLSLAGQARSIVLGP